MNNVSLSQLSRRRFIVSAGLAAGAIAVNPRGLFPENKGGIVPTMIDAASTATIKTHPVRRNVAVLDGSGGNIAVLIGKDGKLLIDSGFTVSKPRVLEALNNLSSDPITQLINTHWHTDHTDGNAWVHGAGAAITAHTNTQKHLSTSTRVEAWNWTFPPAPDGALPKTTFDDKYRLQHNDTHITLEYYGPSHTDSDISVTFEEADVIHVGDTWWNGIYPFIDYSTGGNIDGTIRAAKWNLSKVTNQTIVIPGHGPVGDKAGLTEFCDMLVNVRGKVADLKKQGKSLEETIAAKPTSAHDAKFGHFLITPAFFTTLVYLGV